MKEGKISAIPPTTEVTGVLAASMNYRSDKEKIVNGVTISTKKKVIENFNVLEATAGTNGLHDGDSGHGSRSYMKIQEVADGDIKFKLLYDDDYERQRNNPNGVEIKICGDSELVTMMEALEFIYNTLAEKL